MSPVEVTHVFLFGISRLGLYPGEDMLFDSDMTLTYWGESAAGRDTPGVHIRKRYSRKIKRFSSPLA